MKYFVSPMDHVIFFSLYKIIVHQKILYTFYFKNSGLIELDSINLQSVVYLYHKQSQVLEGMQKYCKLIGQKLYHMCG